MTRFWLTLEEGVRFVIRCVGEMQGGEVFVPKSPSVRIVDLAEAAAPGCEIEIVGIRPGEKLHEVLISRDESRSTLELEDMFVIEPSHSWWEGWRSSRGKPLADGFKYASDTNDRWLTVEEIRQMIRDS
jgi:UDP-N-acetylglucosamine 4,6-dehydratase